jgi:hypothetical protein
MKNQRFHLFRFGKLAAITAAACAGWVSLVSAQVPPRNSGAEVSVQPIVPVYDNPLNRNPRHRSPISDAAPVAQLPGNSTTRPTLPAASLADPERSYIPPPDPSRSTRN